MLTAEITLVVLSLASLLKELAAHGLMQSPPARNYMWRLGFDTERNYDDMGLNCGGFSNQWDTNGGRCGTCGDPYQGPRSHEAGGFFANIDRPVSQCYHRNSKIDVKIRITAYHKGYFEFRLCEHNDLSTPVSQGCLDRTVLTISGSNQTKYDIGYVKKEFYTFQLDIPKDIACDQCVIQWLYNTGNSYGCDAHGCGIGLGRQEQFINCADITILPDCTDFTVQMSKAQTTTHAQRQSQNTQHDWSHEDLDQSHGEDDDWGHSHNTDDNWDSFYDSDDDEGDFSMTTEKWPIHGYTDSTNSLQTTGAWYGSPSTRSYPFDCYAFGLFAHVSGSHHWCQANCHADPPYCPETHCRCGDPSFKLYEEDKRCSAVGFWAQLTGFSDWCNLNCNHNPSFCPAGVCQCY